MNAADRISKKYSHHLPQQTPTATPIAETVAAAPALAVDLSDIKEDILSGVKELLSQHSQPHTPSEYSPNASKSEMVDFSGVKEDILSGVKELLSQHSQPIHNTQQPQNTVTNAEMATFMSYLKEMSSNTRIDSSSNNENTNTNKCTDDKTRVTEEKFSKYKHVATIYDLIKIMHNLGSFDHYLSGLNSIETRLTDLSKAEISLKQRKIVNSVNEIKNFKTDLEGPIDSIKEASANKKNIFITDFNAATRENPFSSDISSICEKKECMGSSELISSTCAALIFKNTGDIS